MRYYELIGPLTLEVIGVCSEDGLLCAVEADNVKRVGQITKHQFDAYADTPWTNPIARIVYTVKIVPRVELTDATGVSGFI